MLLTSPRICQISSGPKSAARFMPALSGTVVMTRAGFSSP